MLLDGGDETVVTIRALRAVHYRTILRRVLLAGSVKRDVLICRIMIRCILQRQLLAERRFFLQRCYAGLGPAALLADCFASLGNKPQAVLTKLCRVFDSSAVGAFLRRG